MLMLIALRFTYDYAACRFIFMPYIDYAIDCFRRRL